jgi:hypothetical protein
MTLKKMPDGSCPAPLPADEPERLKALQEFQVLDSMPEQAFDDIVFLASHICQTPIALVSLVDSSPRCTPCPSPCAPTTSPRRCAASRDVRDPRARAPAPAPALHGPRATLAACSPCTSFTPRAVTGSRRTSAT